MRWIDIALVALALLAAVRGWRTGVLGQLGGLLGRIGGLLAGLRFGPAWSLHLTHAPWRGAVVVSIVLATSSVGALVGRWAGTQLGRQLPFRLLRTVDHALGAGVAVSGLVFVVWLVAGVAGAVTWWGVSQQVNQSVVLTTLQRVLPAPPAMLGRVQALVSGAQIPNVFAFIGPRQLPTWPFVQTGSSVAIPAGIVSVSVHGGCVLAHLSTGVVVAPGEVLTTAHAVAGATHVVVQGATASVVFFDPRSDVAVLRATTLSVPPVAVATTETANTAVVVATTQRATSGIDRGGVVVASRGIYSGAVAPRAIELIATANVTTTAIVFVNGAVVGVVVAPSPANANVDVAAPLASVQRALAHAGRVAVSTHGCVS